MKQLSTVLLDTIFLTILELLCFCYFNYSFYSHIVKVFANSEGHWTTSPLRLSSFSLYVLILVETSTSMWSKYGGRRKKVPGSWDIQQGYNCIQEYTVVKPREQSSGGFCSHQVLRVELQPCKSECGWLILLYDTWVSIHVVVKTHGSLPGMDSATLFPSPVLKGALLLFCCCSVWQVSFSRLCWTVPVPHLPPHSRFGTFSKLPQADDEGILSQL